MLLICGLFFVISYLRIVSSVNYTCNSNATCGCSRNAAVVTKIIGGENAVSDSWGWAVSLFIDERILCGGTIISSSWIITAAHCVEGMDPSQVIIYAATNAIYSMTQYRYSSAIIRHPQYNSNTFENDIALVQVSPAFNMTDPGMAKICLPMATEQDFPAINSTLVALGWGYMMEGSDTANILQQVTLQRISYNDSRCSSLVTNQSVQFCAGVAGGDKGPCSGDSGGPLMMFSLTRQWTIVGIYSYRQGCENTNHTPVFTRMVPYLNWVRTMNISDAITVQNYTGSAQIRKLSPEKMLVSLLINIFLWYLF